MSSTAFESRKKNNFLQKNVQIFSFVKLSRQILIVCIYSIQASRKTKNDTSRNGGIVFVEEETLLAFLGGGSCGFFRFLPGFLGELLTL